MSFILDGTIEAAIDNELTAIIKAMRKWEVNLRRITLQGYSPLRAAYMLNGSPCGSRSRAIKLWLIRRKNQDREFQRKMREIDVREIINQYDPIGTRLEN